jgi:hypothetical protein
MGRHVSRGGGGRSRILALVLVPLLLLALAGGGYACWQTRSSAREYDDDYVNSVVIMTDGKNDDPGGGLDLKRLLARTRATSKGDRPVRVITIGMGEADPAAIKAISRATGGTWYIANTPADIQRVFVQALLARTAK